MSKLERLPILVSIAAASLLPSAALAGSLSADQCRDIAQNFGEDRGAYVDLPQCYESLGLPADARLVRVSADGKSRVVAGDNVIFMRQEGPDSSAPGQLSAIAGSKTQLHQIRAVVLDETNGAVVALDEAPPSGAGGSSVFTVLTFPLNRNGNLIPLRSLALPTGPGPIAVALDPKRDLLYVLSTGATAVRAFPLRADNTGTLPATQPQALYALPGAAYAVSPGDDLVVDPVTGAVSARNSTHGLVPLLQAPAPAPQATASASAH